MPLLTATRQDQSTVFHFAGVNLTSIEQVDSCLDQLVGTKNNLDKLIKRITTFSALPPTERTKAKRARLLNALQESLVDETFQRFLQEIQSGDDLQLESLKDKLESLKNSLWNDIENVAKELVFLYSSGGHIVFTKESEVQRIDVPEAPGKCAKYNKIVAGKDLRLIRYWIFEWFTDSHASFHSFRLFVVRGLRELWLLFPKVFAFVGCCFMFKVVMGALSIIYLINAVSVLLDSYHSSLRPDGSCNWDLFWDTVKGKASLLLNELVWGIINLVSFLLLLGQSPLQEVDSLWNIALSNNNAVKISDAINDEVNIAGFIADVPNDGASAYLKTKGPRFVSEIKAESAAAETTLLYELVRLNARKTAEDKQYRFWRALKVALIIATGMLLFYVFSLFSSMVLFGIVSAATCKLIGASLALFGSLYGGFGARIRDTEAWKSMWEFLGEKWDSLCERFRDTPPYQTAASQNKTEVATAIDPLLIHLSLMPKEKTGITPDVKSQKNATVPNQPTPHQTAASQNKVATANVISSPPHLNRSHSTSSLGELEKSKLTFFNPTGRKRAASVPTTIDDQDQKSMSSTPRVNSQSTLCAAI